MTSPIFLVKDYIHASATRHLDLLEILADTEHAEESLRLQKEYVSGLKRELASIQSRIEIAEMNCSFRRLEYDQHRKSVSARLSRLSSSGIEPPDLMSKPEQELIAAKQKLQRALDSRENVNRLLAQASAAESEYQSLTERNEAARQRLEELYEAIFEGPTPGFPEEDSAERDYQTISKLCDEARRRAESVEMAIVSLEKARSELEKALGNNASTKSPVRKVFFNRSERNNVGLSDASIARVQVYVSQAGRLAPVSSISSWGLPPMKLEDGDSITPECFHDDIFGDPAFADKLKQSRPHIRSVANALVGRLDAVRKVYDSLKEQLGRRESETDKARERLQDERRKAIEATRNLDRPPDYADISMDVSIPA
jgi:chromosome segregation ATPase